MRPFNYLNAASFDEASAAIKNGDTVAIAGGGDMLNALKDDIFETYPKLIVSLTAIPDADCIKKDGETLVIGALATLADIARSEAVLQNAPILAQAAGSASSPTLRETTTIGGNICQHPRCWYYRKLNNRFDCARKGGERCFALSGDNRYHSVFGAASFETAQGKKRSCVAVNQGELAPVLIALDATILTTKREIKADDFFTVGVMSSTVLEHGELVREIHIPIAARRCRYKRFAFRKTIDFPVINLAISVDDNDNYRICLGGVAPLPYRAKSAEELLCGRKIDLELAEQAGLAAADGAKPFEANAYKVQLMKTLVKRELIAL